MLYLDDRDVPVRLQRLLDVPQQMLLVHAGSRMDMGVHLGDMGDMDMGVHLNRWKGVRKQFPPYFSHVVEISMRNSFLLSQLSDLV